MNTEMMLVCKIIQTGKMRDVLEFGLAPEDFTSPEARTMYERILSVYQRAESSGSVLGPTLAKEVFPNLPWTEVDEHVTVDHLCHEVRSNRLRVLFRMALAEAIPKLDGKDLRGAVSSISDALGAYHRIGDTKNYDMAGHDGFATALDIYDKRKKGLDPGVCHWAWYDVGALTGPIYDDDYIVLYGRPKNMKALANSAKLLTPSGWIRNGDVKVGDLVIGSNGMPTRVLGVYPQGKRPMFKVTMNDGGSTRCCGDHLWFTQTRNERRRGSSGSAKITSEMIGTLKGEDGQANHSIPIVKPVHFDHQKKLALDPYVLGALLGGGHLGPSHITITKPDMDLLEKVHGRLPFGARSQVGVWGSRCPSMVLHGIHKAVKSLGLLGKRAHTKFIPREYFTASIPDRLELLRGLLDTGGSVGPSGAEYTFSSTSAQLRDGVVELARSLGALVTASITEAKVYTYKGETLECKPLYLASIHFFDRTVPVSISSRLEKVRRSEGSKEARCRQIVSIEPDGEEECLCIAVDAPDHLYVTDDFIVTHNTWCLLKQASACVFEQQVPTVIYTKEMTRDNVFQRLASIATEMPYGPVRLGGLDPIMEAKFRKDIAYFIEMLRKREKDNLLWVLSGKDMPGRDTISWFRSKVEKYKPKVAFIDGMYLMTPENSKLVKTNERLENVSRAARQMILDTKVPLFCTLQANRQAAKHEKGEMDEIAMSDAVSQDCTAAIRTIKDKVLDPDTGKHTCSLVVAGAREWNISGFRIFAEPSTDFSFQKILDDKEAQNVKATDDDESEKAKKKKEKGKDGKPTELSASSKIQQIALGLVGGK
jgi:replicative DNA helicase